MASKKKQLICVACGKINKPSAVECKACGAELEASADGPSIRPFYNTNEIIVVPAGQPPCKPKNVDNPNGNDIVEWAQEIMSIGRQRQIRYSISAIKYWARYFWYINNPVYDTICDILDLNAALINS